MNDNDINELIKKAKYMIQNNQIPDDIKNIISSNTQNTNINYNQNGSQNNTKYNSQNNSQNNAKYNSQNNSQNNAKYNSQNSSQNNAKYNPQNGSQNNTKYNSQNSSQNNTEYNPQNDSQNNTKYNPQNDSQSNSQNNGSFSDIDMETLMKLQSIMSKMKNSENDDMSKLLLSLKPYLRDGRKEKVDEYIQLIKMGKMTELFNSFGGDKK